MSARADWHTLDLAALVEEEGELDPFSAPVEELGERIDLTDPAERLQVRLGQLLDRESAIRRRGVGCAIKDKSDTVCLACPVSQHADFDEPLGMLCRVGRDQEKVCTELGALLCQRG